MEKMGQKEGSYMLATQCLKIMGNNSIQNWYLDIWQNSSIPEMARSVVQRLPEDLREFAPGYILGEQLPSTVERVVYEHLLSGVITTEQAAKLFKDMDDASFLPTLRMYPILFELIKRSGLTLKEYMERQTDARDKSASPYSCVREKEYSDEVEELYSILLTNPVLLLGYLVRLEPEILAKVKL